MLNRLVNSAVQQVVPYFTKAAADHKCFQNALIKPLGDFISQCKQNFFADSDFGLSIEKEVLCGAVHRATSSFAVALTDDCKCNLVLQMTKGVHKYALAVVKLKAQKALGQFSEDAAKNLFTADS